MKKMRLSILQTTTYRTFRPQLDSQSKEHILHTLHRATEKTVGRNLERIYRKSFEKKSVWLMEKM